MINRAVKECSTDSRCHRSTFLPLFSEYAEEYHQILNKPPTRLQHKTAKYTLSMAAVKKLRDDMTLTSTASIPLPAEERETLGARCSRCGNSGSPCPQHKDAGPSHQGTQRLPVNGTPCTRCTYRNSTAHFSPQPGIPTRNYLGRHARTLRLPAPAPPPTPSAPYTP